MRPSRPPRSANASVPLCTPHYHHTRTNLFCRSVLSRAKHCEEIFTARKRSLGQGNIFTSVCQEFCSQGGRVPGPGGYLVPGGAWSRGCLVPGGAWSQEGVWRTPPGRLLLRALRILLECILVQYDFILTLKKMSTLLFLPFVLKINFWRVFLVHVHTKYDVTSKRRSAA